VKNTRRFPYPGAVGLVLVLSLSAFFFRHGLFQDDLAWLKGSVDERFHAVAKHLRGFDMAMVETSHRYAELYWAGRDGNWGYADYQIKKIKTAIENGLERRPKRSASAQTFLTTVIPYLQEAIARKDSMMFWYRFSAVTSACNTCHQNEQMAFVVVSPPTVRSTVVMLHQD